MKTKYEDDCPFLNEMTQAELIDRLGVASDRIGEEGRVLAGIQLRMCAAKERKRLAA